MRSANAYDPPNESFFLFNKRSVAVSSRQRGRCQLDMVNKLLIPAPLCGRSTPDRNLRAGVGVRCSLRERTHVRKNPNPGSRRARLAGAVHRDDRHLDPGTGKFVTVAVVPNYRTFSRGSSALRCWSTFMMRSVAPHSPSKFNAFLFTELTKFLYGATSAQIFLAKQCKH